MRRSKKRRSLLPADNRKLAPAISRGEAPRWRWAEGEGLDEMGDLPRRPTGGRIKPRV